MESPALAVTGTDSRSLHSEALSIFRGLAASYDRVVDGATFFQDRYWKSWAVRNLGQGGGALALDIGCGTLLFEERVGCRGWTFVGLDLTEEMLKLGKAKNLGNVGPLVAGDGERLPFPDETFGAVVSCYVPKYIDVKRLAAELGRICKPGATAVLYDFARPTGAFAPFLNLYIRGGLGVMAYLLGVVRREEATTFAALPGIIERTTWDRQIVGAMQGAGFSPDEARTLTAGAVYAYCGKKRMAAELPF